VDGGFESQATSDVYATYVFGAAFKAMGPDLARASGATSEQLASANGLPSVLKWIERGAAPEFDHRIHSWLALTRVQSDSFPAAMSMVHFADRTGGRTLEPAGLAIEPKRMNVDKKQVIEKTIPPSELGCLIADFLLSYSGRRKIDSYPSTAANNIPEVQRYLLFWRDEN
jgi:hypothetical protein